MRLKLNVFNKSILIFILIIVVPIIISDLLIIYNYPAKLLNLKIYLIFSLFSIAILIFAAIKLIDKSLSKFLNSLLNNINQVSQKNFDVKIKKGHDKKNWEN